MIPEYFRAFRYLQRGIQQSVAWCHEKPVAAVVVILTVCRFVVARL